ncbi:MAG: hypothetical protein C0490_15205 [Marivirga sp.]|nr:hypothetical protein [Marivirga sp.]
MKKSMLLLFIIISTCATAQDLIVSAGAELTVKGHQYGGSLLLETRKLWGAGVFYQAGISRDTGEGNLNNPFYGIALQAPIASSERILFGAVMRMGLVNDRFFVVVPSLETRISITPKAGASLAAGLRYGYPSLSARIFFKLF